jgi:hypothetical protein
MGPDARPGEHLPGSAQGAVLRAANLGGFRLCNINALAAGPGPPGRLWGPAIRGEVASPGPGHAAAEKHDPGPTAGFCPSDLKGNIAGDLWRRSGGQTGANLSLQKQKSLSGVGCRVAAAQAGVLP